MVKTKQIGLLVLILMSISASVVHAQQVNDIDVVKSPNPAVNKSDQRMSFSLQDVPVRGLLQTLSEVSGVNMVADESVAGTVTLNLKDTTWQEALAVITLSKKLNVEQQNGTYFISGNNIGFSDDVYGGTYDQTEAIELRYQRAEDVRKMIVDQGARFLSAQGAITADTLTNQLLIQDAPDRVAQIKSLIRKIDVPAKQVLIEARIVEAGDSFSRNLGIKLGFNDLARTGYRTIPDPANLGQTIQIPVQAPSKSGVVLGSSIANVQRQSGQDTSITNSMINFPAVSALANPSTFAVSLFRSGVSQFINLEISALETDGKGKVISSPRVVTSNNVKAVIEQGTEIPYQQTTILGSTSTTFRRANLKLEVTPQITPSGDVVMDVDVTKDSVGTLLTNAGYTINTKHVQTQVKVENGGTVVIGGIYQEETQNSENKVPLLGDIPVLGYLFKTKNKTINKTELLIFLTPHLLDAKGQPITTSATASIDTQIPPFNGNNK